MSYDTCLQELKMAVARRVDARGISSETCRVCKNNYYRI